MGSASPSKIKIGKIIIITCVAAALLAVGAIVFLGLSKFTFIHY